MLVASFASVARVEVNAGVRTGASTADLESSYTYDNEGRMLSVQYPGSQTQQTGSQAAATTSPGPNLGYAYDTMGRLNTMSDLAAFSTIIFGTTYDTANRLLSIAGSYNLSYAQQQRPAR